jgi:hypothetical protein
MGDECFTMMNQRGIGPLLIILVVVLGAVLFIPAIAVMISNEIRLLFQVMASIVIFTWVRNTVGPGIISIAIAGILIYIFVFVLTPVTASIWALYYLVGLGLFGMILWGLIAFKGI